MKAPAFIRERQKLEFTPERHKLELSLTLIRILKRIGEWLGLQYE